jgi:hypothetical protein
MGDREYPRGVSTGSLLQRFRDFFCILSSLPSGPSMDQGRKKPFAGVDLDLRL